MNGNCKTCDVEKECGYPYKPCDCANYRKFRPIEKPSIRAEVIPIRKVQDEQNTN